MLFCVFDNILIIYDGKYFNGTIGLLGFLKKNVSVFRIIQSNIGNRHSTRQTDKVARSFDKFLMPSLETKRNQNVFRLLISILMKIYPVW